MPLFGRIPGPSCLCARASSGGAGALPVDPPPPLPPALRPRPSRGFRPGRGASLKPRASRRQPMVRRARRRRPAGPNGRAPVELSTRSRIWPARSGRGPRRRRSSSWSSTTTTAPGAGPAEKARDTIRLENADIRVGLVNNPILSPASAQAAKVDLALLKLKGAGASYGVHSKLFSVPGRIDGPRALDAAAALGADRRQVEELADSAEIGESLGRQMRLAASLGIAADALLRGGRRDRARLPRPGRARAIVARYAGCGTIGC